MAFDGTDPAWCVGIPLSRAAEWRLRTAQFGDGYAQRTLDGINALNLKWSVAFENRTSSVLLAMDAYLQAQKANSFMFRDPAAGVLYPVFCDQWQIDWTVTKVVNGVRQSLYGSLTAEFIKANGVTV